MPLSWPAPGPGKPGFRVQQHMCRTCIYRPSSPLDLERLEAEIRDPHMGFKSYRICHHSEDVCCRGFWDRHKDAFATGQIAQRLDAVEWVQVDTLKRPPADGRSKQRREMEVQWNGDRLEKRAAIAKLKDEGFQETRTWPSGTRHILYRYDGGASYHLTVIRLREWHHVQVSLDEYTESEPSSEGMGYWAAQIGNDDALPWQP